MECPNCGANVPDGLVYCPKCGEEVQIISAVDDLEDEILRELVDDNNHGKPRENVTAGAAKENNRIKESRSRQLWLRILVIVVIAAAAAVIGVFGYTRSQSPERLLARAQAKYEQSDYERAWELLDKLLEKDAGNMDAMILAGQVYAAASDYENAESMFLRAIAFDPASADAYEGLLRVYDAQGMRDEILALKKTVTDEKILALFDDFVTPEPEILVQSGTFDDYFTVGINAPKNSLTVYYTLDGTVPTRNSMLYVSPVEISDQGLTTLTAVCMDEDGNYSEPVSAEYLVELTPPDMPVATPDGGEFSTQETVTVTAPDDTDVYYTWDNSEPDINSDLYTEPIYIPEGNHVLSLVAVDSRGIYSNVLKCNFIYYPQTTSQTIPDTYSTAVEDTQSIQGIEIMPEETEEYEQETFEEPSDEENGSVAIELEEYESEDVSEEFESEMTSIPLDIPAEED